LIIRAIPPLAGGLVVNRKGDLLNCTDIGLRGDAQVGKGHDLLAVGWLSKADDRRNAVRLNYDVCRAGVGVCVRRRSGELVILAATRGRQHDTGGWNPVCSRKNGWQGNHCPLEIRAIPILAGGLDRERDLLNCSRAGLGRSGQTGKGDDLLAVGRMSETDDRLRGGLMNTCEQGSSQI